ncbi:hypothetical protein [Sphingomonas sp.]|uniref:hypothetical protein n=1 Tax=Sphingomonas sp. TaxID=28214 RepID=UPI003B3A431C
MKAAAHPAEHDLPLSPAVIGELQQAVRREGAVPTIDRQRDFILRPVPPRPAA